MNCPFEPDDESFLEGDCPDCGGTGEIFCSCDDRDCSRCVDGLRTCPACSGTGFLPREPDGQE